MNDIFLLEFLHLWNEKRGHSNCNYHKFLKFDYFVSIPIHHVVVNLQSSPT